MRDEGRADVLEYVRTQEVVELLRAMVRAESVNPPADTRACASLLMDVCLAEGIDVERVEGRPGAVNVVARLSGGWAGRRVILNGHIDTVPAGDGWTVDPFGGELRDGCIWGRGTCDMKAGVAAILMAMVELKRSGQPFAGEIVFQAVADEESGSRWGTLHLIEQGYCRDADYAICTEPTSNRIELGNRGLRWIDITVSGEASHAGRPGLGINAVSAAAEIIRNIDALEFTLRDERFEIPAPSVSVTTIEGGHTVNVIPDRCAFSIDRRMLPGETEASVLAELEAAIAPVRAGCDGIEVDMTVRPGCWDPFVIEPDEPVALATVEAAREVLGREPQVGYKAACTDASHLVNRAGIPTVLLGPGNERLSHKPDERIAVYALAEGAAIYSVALRRLLD
jgi:acetylornithine deacetylase/succinyl-diaminopimelate desuccinylase family protein